MDPWNLTPKEWSNVLLKGRTPERIAKDVTTGELLPWTENLLQSTKDSKEILDMGCGAGQHSALLAMNGRKMTLLDISQQNLNFSSRVFKILGLDGRFLQADMTKPLPFEKDSFDTVFSIGVFEYFTDEEIRRILKEAFRVARKRVIIMVPNAFSIAYRLGYWYLRKTKRWIWGGERPFYTLKPYFYSTGHTRFFEFTVAAKHSLGFLAMPAVGLIKEIIIRALRLEDNSNPAFFRQGYLLISIGEKN